MLNMIGVIGYKSATDNVVKLACDKLININSLSLNNSNNYFFCGILGGMGKAILECTKNNITYYYADHAYLNRGYENQVCRLTKNRDIAIKKYDYDNNRRKLFNYRYSSWRGCTKGYILICPPTQPIRKLYNLSEDWITETISYIKNYSNKEIVIRIKPEIVSVDDNFSKISPQNIIIPPGIRISREKDIRADLNLASYVVTFNSNVSVDATLLGVPLADIGIHAAKSVSFSISELENGNVPEPNRESWLNYITYNQFTYNELKSGKALSIIEEYQ